MTREQAKNFLIKLGIAEPTDTQVTEYLNTVSNERRDAENDRDKYKTDAEKAAALQAEIDTLKSKGMTDVEKALAEAKKAKEDADLLSLNFKKQTSRLGVEKLLLAAGLKEEDYKDYIDDIVSDDSEKSTRLANGFIKTIVSQKESAVAQHKKDLMHDTGKPGGSGAGNGTTKTEAEEIAENLSKASSSSSADINKYYITGGK